MRIPDNRPHNINVRSEKNIDWFALLVMLCILFIFLKK